MPAIAFILQTFYGDQIGGAERQVQMLGAALRQAGWQTAYICERAKDKPKRENIQGMDVLALPQRKKRWTPFNYPYLKAALRESGADLFYQRVRHPYTGMTARAAGNLGKAFVWAAASTADLVRTEDLRQASARPSRQDRLVKPLIRRIEDGGILHAGAIILQTQEQLQLLEQNYGRKGTVIPNHLVIGGGAETIPKNSPPEILWLSNIKSFKRPELFLELAGRCRDLEARFVMAGACPDPRMLADILRAENKLPHFTYLGPLEPVASEKRIAASTVLVNTSLFEGFPNAFQQAWYHGVPTLTLTADPDNIIARENLGGACGTVEMLETQVRRLLADRLWRDDLAVRAREFARRNYDLTNLLPRYLSVFESLTKP